MKLNNTKIKWRVELYQNWREIGNGIQLGMSVVYIIDNQEIKEENYNITNCMRNTKGDSTILSKEIPSYTALD